MEKRCFIIILLGVFIFSGFRISESIGATQSVEPLPFLRVPPAKKFPVIDGKYSEEEWKYAAAVTGFIAYGTNVCAYRQSVFFLTYDSDNLYICLRSPIFPKGREIAATFKERDREWFGDDVIELLLDPYFGDHSGSKPYYYFIGNSRGMIYDLRNMPGIGQVDDLNWNGNWIFENSVDEKWWTAELSIPFEILKQDGGKDGYKWCININRTYTAPVTWTSWSGLAGGINQPHHSARVILDREVPIVRFLSIEPILQGRAGLQMELGNSTTEEIPVLCSFNLETDGKKIFEKQIKKTLKPDDFCNVILDEETKLGEKNIMHVSVTSPDGNKLYYEAWLPFLERTPQPKTELKKESYLYNVRYLPSQKRVVVNTDITSFDRANEADHAVINLIDMNGGEIISKEMQLSDGEGYLEMKVDISDGTYIVRMVLVDAKGGEISKRDYTFLKKDYSWLGNNLGKTSDVLPPWTPLSLEGSTITCWGRKYTFDGLSLPSSIIVRQPEPSWGRPESDDILAGPIKLVITKDGMQNNITGLNIQPKVISKEKNEVLLEGTYMDKNCPIIIKAKVEYDGLISYDMVLLPGEDIVEDLTLEIPLNSKCAKYIHAVGDVLRTGSIGKLLPEGEGIIWKSGSLYKSAIYGTFVPYVWLGDEDRGVCWYADSDEGWITKDSRDILEIYREGNVVKLLVHFIAKRTKVTTERKIRFGIQATPVKPMPSGWRAWSFEPDWPRTPGTYRIHWYPGRSNIWDTEYLCGLLPKNMERHKETFKAFKKESDVEEAALYVDLMTVGAQGLPERKAFLGEWAGGKEMAGMFDNWAYERRLLETDDKEAYMWVKSDFVPSNIDYRIWALDKLVKGEGVDILYQDNFWPSPNVDIEMGIGYEREDGRLQPEVNITALREYHKRLAGVFYQNAKKIPISWAHMTSTTVIPYLSFATIAYDGEWREISSSKVDFMDQWPLDYFLSEGMGRQYGLVPLWLPMAHYVKDREEMEKITRGMLGLLMLHDILCDNSHAASEEIRKAEVAKGRFGMDDHSIRFYGYWSNSPIISTGSDKVKASIWAKSGRAMVVLTNFNREDEDVTILFDTKNLGFETMQCLDLETEEKVELENSGDKASVKCKISGRDYRLLIFTGYSITSVSELAE